jgi:hypothetical protein
MSADSRLISQVDETEGANPRNVRTSPGVPKDQHPFAASSESALRIMKNPRLPEIGRNTSGESGQPPCCLACIGDIGGANGQ